MSGRLRRSRQIRGTRRRTLDRVIARGRPRAESLVAFWLAGGAVPDETEAQMVIDSVAAAHHWPRYRQSIESPGVSTPPAT
jgi:hypothetical protein